MSRIITGAELRQDLLRTDFEREAIVCDLLFAKDIFLLTSDSGAGKSIFATQLAICLSFKRPFIGLDIPKARKVLYIQLEGDYEENVERMRFMESEGGIIIEEDNILWVEEKTLDVLDPGSVAGFFGRIEKTGFKPEVTIVDPIYKLSGQDICNGVAALGVIKFSDAIQNKWGCANVLIHHNIKDSYSSLGQKITKDDAYYGHSFIKNHIRTSYAMTITGENTRSLIRKKGRGSDTKKSFRLEYDPECWTLFPAEVSVPHKRGKNHERFYTFLEMKHSKKESTSASEIIEECEITYGQLRNLKNKDETKKLFSLKKLPDKNKELWLPNLD